jgi:hypothetical protein
MTAKRTIIATLLTIAACDPGTSTPSTLRDACVCTTGTTGTTGEPEPQTLEEAIASMGAVAGPDDGESIWGTYPDGRRFRVRYPAGWSAPSPLRVIFALHPCSAQRASTPQWDSYHWPANGHFAIVLPEAEGNCWETSPGSADFAHVERVIEGVESWPWVDDTRRLAGWSGGTFAAQSIACTLGADVVVAGSGGLRYLDTGELPEACVPGPTDVWLHHGQADTTVPLATGQEAVDYWASVLGCTDPAPDATPIDYCAEVGISCAASPGCVRYTCEAGSLRWCVDESGHSQQYPGRAAREVGEVLFGGGGGS